MSTKKLKVNDKVKRAQGQGCHGTIKDIRAESMGSISDTREKPLLVTVQWDNGTLSTFAPESLEAVK